MGARALGALVAGALLAFASCGGDEVDLAAAREFEGFALLWAGERFEEWEVTHLEIPAAGGFALIVYGDCTPSGGDEPSCTPPLQLQIQPLCAHLADVARAPIWKQRSIRGAPVGTIDSAPVLFTRNVQVKAYRGEGSDAGLAWRALVALRSLNAVPPLVRPSGPIPGPVPGVLEGERPCAP
jgi:hypothetical protein